MIDENMSAENKQTVAVGQRRISTTDYEDSVKVDIENMAAKRDTSVSLVPEEEEAAPKSSKKEFAAKTCPIEGVTVFLDRAEVKKIIEVNLDAGGNEVLVTGLPTVTDLDSVRVQCFGDATIIEVSNRTEKIFIKNAPPTNAEEAEHEIHDLKRKKIEIQKDVDQTKDMIELLEKERSFVTTYGQRLKPSEKIGDKLVEAFDKKSLESVTAFLEFYRDNSQRLNDEIFAANEKIKEMGEEIKKIDDRLKKLAPLGQTGETSYDDKQVSILLEAENQTELKLILSYVVSNASWTPLYDLRAFSKDNTLQLFYFGDIKQQTGEDWNDAKLSLSTAMPSVGGSPPHLDTLHIQSLEAVKYRVKSRRSFKKAHRSYMQRNERVAHDFVSSYIEDSYAPSGLAREAPLPQAATSEGITSTTFEIARNSTVQTDNTEHKVSICQIDLKPTFEYTSVPKLVAHAFLKAKVTNDSNYALLAGPANVFLDNNFLTKSSMEAVSPLEEFDVSLGVDPAVKITYKPLKKFKQSTGILSKYELLQFHQEITIKNTKSTSVKITVTDQLPKTSEEKLKVNVIEPVIPVLKKNEKPNADQPIKLNDKNNVEWILEIPASETKEVSLKYTVEHPANLVLTGL